MTTRGRAVGLVTLALGVGGALLRWPPLLVLMAGGAAMLLTALAAMAGAAAVTVQLEPATVRVMRGTERALSVRISNGSAGRSPRGELCVDGAPEPLRMSLSPLRPRTTIERTVALRPLRRGRYDLGPAVLVDRFGLLQRIVGTTGGVTMFVTPAVAPVRIATREGRSRVAGMERSGSPRGPTFERLRAYAWGDDTRRIHWPSSARTGQLQVRETFETATPAATVVLDTQPEAYGGADEEAERAFDVAVDVVASVAVSALASRHAVSVQLGTGLRWRGRPRADPSGLLDLLAPVRRVGGVLGDLPGDPLLRRPGRDVLVVLVTGPRDTGQGQWAAKAAARVANTVLIRARGTAGPPVAGVTTLDIDDAAELGEVGTQPARRSRPRR